MNRTRVLKTVILPLLIAGLATAGIYHTLARQPATPATPTVDTVPVVVASRSVPALTLLTAEMVAVREVPAAYVLSGTVRSIESCVGRVAMVPLAAGEVLLTSKISSQQPGAAGLSFVIAAGKRAITVQVDEISGVAAFPRPSDRVDILVTFKTAGTQANEAVDQRTRLLLENIAILAVVQEVKAPEDSEPRELRGYTSLTLEVTPEQGAIIAAAEAQGFLRYLLRPTLDDAVVGQFDISGVALQQAAQTLNTNVDRRIGFDVRLMEVDAAALAGLGHATYGASMASLTASEAAALSGLVFQDQARVLQAATTSTNNRTAVSVSIGGEVRAPESAGLQPAPYGLEVRMTPSYYGQPSITVETRVSLTVVDVAADGLPVSSTVGVGAAERLAGGEALMVVGLAVREDFAAATGGARYLLPAEFLTDALVQGDRVLVVLISPSF